MVVWIVYVLNDATTLAWVAFVDLLVVAVVGDVLVARWTRDRRAGGTPGSTSTASGGRRGVTGTMTAHTPGLQLAEQGIPAAAVILHGAFAVTTVVLVLLSALEIGGS